MLILPVSATGRHDSTPAMGKAAALSAGSSLSISADTSLSRSATPLIRVTWTAFPHDRGNQVMVTRFRCTAPARQSPYIFVKNASFRNLPGSAFNAGGAEAPTG